MKSVRLPSLADLRSLTVELRPRRARAASEAQPVFDLLRERRQEIGQHAMAPVLASRRRLLLQGSAIGAGFLGVVLGFTALVSLRHQLVKTQMGQLNQVDTEAQGLRAELARRGKRLATITEVNRQLAVALSTVRPSSAVLSELQLRTPEGVQLVSAEAAANALLVKGLAEDPLAFARINAMQLEMSRSPLLDPLGITLSKLERRSENATTAPSTNGPNGSTGPARPVPVHFEISGRFAEIAPAKLQQVLQQLGSRGMARRLELMQKGGLMP
ncbi:MAG: PilN domain-containing protein [Cyanobium sp.]